LLRNRILDHGSTDPLNLTVSKLAKDVAAELPWAANGLLAETDRSDQQTEVVAFYLRRGRRRQVAATTAPQRTRLRSVENIAQFDFGPFQNALLFLWKIFSGAIDIEVQHRHG
jgi:hypothetical protein